MSTKNVCNLINQHNYTELKKLYNNGELANVNWSIVSRLNVKLSTEEIFNSITGIFRPICKICNTSHVSTFISFNKGYNLYCSKSCAKRDPNVEVKKKISLNKNPNWKKDADNKSKATCLNKYGVTNPLKSSTILEKRKNTNISRYGADEVLSNVSSLRKKLTINIGKDKLFSRISTFQSVIPLFEKNDYSDPKKKYPWECLECSEKFSESVFCGNIPKCPKCFPRSSSTGEKQLFEFVKSLTSTEVIARSKYKGNKEIDVFIPSLNIGIEYNGVYWHSEGKGTPKKYHIDKKKECAALGIKLLQFWDSQWLSKQDIVKSIITGMLGKNERIYARKCELKSISESESSKFLIENHLSGNAKGAFLRLALTLNDQIVCIATFSKPRFSNNDQECIELLRLCSKLNTNVVGGASKLISAAINKSSILKIISFCDEMCFNGGVYKALGFKKVNDGSPSTWYFSGNGQLIHRLAFQKKKLLQKLQLTESVLTEWELAQQLKFNRVWDCGSSKWELDVVSKC